jgi:hypothetical protein
MKIDFDTQTNSVTVDGARFSLEVLEVLANPDCCRFYRFRRVSETVFLKSYSTAEDAELDASGNRG